MSWTEIDNETFFFSRYADTFAYEWDDGIAEEARAVVWLGDDDLWHWTMRCGPDMSSAYWYESEESVDNLDEALNMAASEALAYAEGRHTQTDTLGEFVGIPDSYRFSYDVPISILEILYPCDDPR